MPKIFGIKDKKKGDVCHGLGYSMEKERQVLKKLGGSWYTFSKTLLFFSLFLTWGMAVSVQWATLPDLRIRLGTTVYGPIYAMTIGAMGQMCGGVFSAVSDRYAKASDLMIAGMVFMASTAHLLVPFCDSLNKLGICYMLTNLGFYFMKASAHSQMTSLWGSGSKPARYALQFGFSLGLALGQLVARPLTSGVRAFDPEPPAAQTRVNTSWHEATTEGYETTTEYVFRIVLSPWRDESRIEYAYIAVFAAGIVLAAALVLFFFCALLAGTLHKLQKRDVAPCWSDVLLPRRWADGNVVLGVAVSAMFLTASLLQHFLTLGTHRFLIEFAKDSRLSMDADAISVLSACVLAASAAAGAAGMVCSRFFSIKYILLVVSVGQVVFAIFCLIIGSRYSLGLLLLAPCFVFFRDAAMPTLYAWADNYILLYGVLVGFSDLLNTLATTIFTPFQEHLYHKVAPESIFHTTVAFGIVLFAFTVFMNLYAVRKSSRGTHAQSSQLMPSETGAPVLDDKRECSDIKEVTM